MNKDASWIRKTLRKRSVKEYRDLKSKSKTLTRARDANRRATLMGKKEELKARLQSKKTVAEVKIEDNEPEESTDEYTYDSEYDSESEDEEEARELNELNFNKLIEIRVQTTDFQLDSFCAKYVFVLQRDGVKTVHNMADEFENLCKEIYEPLLRKASPNRRKGTLRRISKTTQKQILKKKSVKIPKELPTHHAKVQKFFQKNEITFSDEEEKEKVFQGLHVGDSCCFLQFLLLNFREMIVEQHLERWNKEKEDIEKKNLGALVLEEFFMPPMKVEPKLDQELVKFSNLMANRQYEINQFKKKMDAKDPKSVAFNILKTEMTKYVKELEEKISVSEIYFAAAIMRVRQKQHKELERIYDLIDEEEKVDTKKVMSDSEGESGTESEEEDEDEENDAEDEEEDEDEVPNV